MVVRDLGSRNGTWVNGERLHGPHVMAPNDTVGIGETLVVYSPDVEALLARDGDSTLIMSSAAALGLTTSAAEAPEARCLGAGGPADARVGARLEPRRGGAEARPRRAGRAELRRGAAVHPHRRGRAAAVGGVALGRGDVHQPRAGRAGRQATARRLGGGSAGPRPARRAHHPGHQPPRLRALRAAALPRGHGGRGVRGALDSVRFEGAGPGQRARHRGRALAAGDVAGRGR